MSYHPGLSLCSGHYLVSGLEKGLVWVSWEQAAAQAPAVSYTICSAAMLRGETLVLGGGTHSSQVSPSAACLSLWAVGARGWDPAALTGRLGYPSSMSLLNRNIIMKSREWGFLHCGHTWKKNK